MKDNKGNQMNRLAYINFLRSEKEEDETNKEHFIRDKEVFDHMLKQLVNKFSMYQTYILPSITKTSKAITINQEYITPINIKKSIIDY